MTTHSLQISAALYQRLSEQAARLQLTPEQALDRLLSDAFAASATADNSDVTVPVPVVGSDAALAAVRRLTTLFADVSIPDLDQALADLTIIHADGAPAR